MLQRSMKNEIANQALLSDADLLREVQRLTSLERQATARLIAALGELDARRLYLGEGCSSLFTYCTQVLHLSEHAAYLRIEAARAARKWPVILELLARGGTASDRDRAARAASDGGQHERVLAAARHKSKREVEEIVAGLRPQPPVPSSIRKLPAEGRSAAERRQSDRHVKLSGAPLARRCNRIAPPVRAARKTVEIKPLAPERYKVQFTVSGETHDGAAGGAGPDAALDSGRRRGAIFERALTLLMTELRRTSTRCRSPARDSSHAAVAADIPAVVSARSGNATAVGARSWARPGGAPSAGFSNITTSSRLPTAARRTPRISSCAAGHTMPSRPSGGSE